MWHRRAARGHLCRRTGSQRDAAGVRGLLLLFAAVLRPDYPRPVHRAAARGHRHRPRRHCGQRRGDPPGLFDVAMLSSVPGITLYSPATYEEMRCSLYKSLYEHTGVCCVRYPRGGESKLPAFDPQVPWAIEPKGAKPRLLLVTYGKLSAQAVQAAQTLSQQGVPTAVLKLLRLLPFCEEAVEQAMQAEYVLFAEEGIGKRRHRADVRQPPAGKRLSGALPCPCRPRPLCRTGNTGPGACSLRVGCTEHGADLHTMDERTTNRGF